jgi:hypothetical protein
VSFICTYLTHATEILLPSSDKLSYRSEIEEAGIIPLFKKNMPFLRKLTLTFPGYLPSETIDLYAEDLRTLGLSEMPSRATLKTVYNILMRHYHSDRNGGNDRQTQEIDEAYKSLANFALKEGPLDQVTVDRIQQQFPALVAPAVAHRNVNDVD